MANKQQSPSLAKKPASDNKISEEQLKKEGDYIILPDVSDIPGQEHVRDEGIPEEMADTTISSDDEEGIRDGLDILDEEDNEQLNMVSTDEQVDDDIISDKQA